MADVQGQWDPAFNSLSTLLAERVASGEELGASICVNIDGKDVVDIWSGYFDPERKKPWDKDTLVPVWSCSKIVTSIAVLILVDRGLINVNEKVATYWPEFAENGKENITVAHIMSHSAGLSTWDPQITWEETFDLEKSTAWLAKQAPWWTPGEGSGYHMMNFGHLLGEIVRRVSGKSLKQFIEDEIAGPLGAEFSLGLVESKWPRASEVIPVPISTDGIDWTSISGRTFVAPPAYAELSATPGFRAAENGAANGFGNARALARIGSLVSLNGTVDDKKYLSPSTIDQMVEERTHGADLVLGHVLRFGLGVSLPVPETVPSIVPGRIVFWCGWGGSIIVMDLDRRMTIGYAMNKMGPGALGNENRELYVQEIYKIVNAL